MKNGKDLRVIKTEKLLKSALFQLLSEKPLEKITVRELSERAEISRATFYLYYDNLDAMVSSIESETLQEYAENIHRLAREAQDYADFLPAALLFTFQNTLDFLPFTRLIYADKIRADNLERSMAVIEQATLELFRRPGDAEKYRLLIAFQINGITAVIRNWVLEDAEKYTPEEMTEITMDYILNGAKIRDELAELTRKR